MVSRMWGGVCAPQPTLGEPEGCPAGDLEVLCLAEAVLTLVSPPRGPWPG